MTIRFTSIMAVIVVIASVGALAQAGDRLDYEATWIGNDFEYDTPDVSGRTVHDVHDIYVTEDGTVYTNVPWEERGSYVSGYRGGDWVVDARTGNSGGGRTITGNETHLFFAGDKHRQGEPGIDRRPLEDVADKQRNVHVACGVVYGLVATHQRVYASVPEENKVKMFTTDLEPVDSWAMQSPVKCAWGRAATSGSFSGTRTRCFASARRVGSSVPWICRKKLGRGMSRSIIRAGSWSPMRARLSRFCL